MRKINKVFYILTIILASLFLVLMALITLSRVIDGVDWLDGLYDFIQKNVYLDSFANSTLTMAIFDICVLSFSIATLAKGEFTKAIPIINMIFSICTINVFGIIASILSIVDIKKIENEKEQAKKEEIKKLILVDAETGNAEIKIIKKKEKKPVQKLNVSTSNMILSIIGAVISVLFIMAYIIVTYIYRNELVELFWPNFDDAGPAMFALIIPIIFLFIVYIVLYLLPIIFFAINIQMTIMMITTKRFFFARVISVYGFVSLSIFNSIAAILILRDNPVIKDYHLKNVDDNIVEENKTIEE